MSAATEFAPVVYIPSRARPREQRTATIVTLQRPCAASVAAPLRLTRRGVVALAVAVVSLAAVLIWTAWLSAPSVATGRPPATVTVRNGDTLWSIATRIAPERDPRAEVATLQRRNHLNGVDVFPGQVLRTH